MTVRSWETHFAERSLQRSLQIDVVKEERHTRTRRPPGRNEEEIANDVTAVIVQELLVVRHLPVEPWPSGQGLRELAKARH
jgi:hypothetical protein